MGMGASRLLFEKCQETRTVPGDRFQTDGQFEKVDSRERSQAPERALHLVLLGDSVSVQDQLGALGKPKNRNPSSQP